MKYKVHISLILLHKKTNHQESIELKFFLLGGLHENGKYENCTGGITGYIDRVVFTDKHLYQYPTCQLVYGRTKTI